MTDGLKKIVRYSCGALLGLLGALAGYQAGAPLLKAYFPDTFLFHGLAIVLSIAVFGFIGVLLAPYFIKLLHDVGLLFERQLRSTAWPEIVAALTGMIVGLVLANLLVLPFSDTPFGPYLTVLLNVLIGFVMAWIFVTRQGDIRGAMASVKERLSQKRKSRAGKVPAEESEDAEPAADPVPRKILDTSVIIDGRILDIAKTGFLQGTLILPSFVLLELQTVADSKDQNRRARGRMGLDVVKELQKLHQVKLALTEASLADYHTEFVDSGVVSMAKKFGYDVLTTDYNLNKVAQIQNVRVLNVNDLANAMKPALLPGDEVTVNLIKQGKDARQGIGYLDNGTMLVVEDGGPYIGKTVEVTLSSLLQTSAGRMVFGRVKREVKS
ncbi:PIN/TRAM domain-containing protein [Pyramidobacter sp.]|uniref:PIN/TRAM domain-containing protein n=1 Tax=Pyramidobacter sp. TaxID=1943581 RepID=UPI0025CEF954|nr:PIN domain-containing protein [Pyramidobacter sp.]MCI7403783.1 TRAM domain-containing protein [Pyramidobacter sp.]MDY3211411.1 TRAM domain-containing protein [Pyramidobacter sp.]